VSVLSTLERLVLPIFHLHGTNVASDGFGDNVKAEYSDNFKVSYKFPKSHNLGLQWWHPHFHGSANSQVYGGAFANLSVGDPLEYLGEEFKDARRSYIGIKNFNLNYSQETGKFEACNKRIYSRGDST
jgi:hypothetical protein